MMIMFTRMVTIVNTIMKGDYDNPHIHIDLGKYLYPSRSQTANGKMEFLHTSREDVSEIDDGKPEHYIGSNCGAGMLSSVQISQLLRGGWGNLVNKLIKSKRRWSDFIWLLHWKDQQ